MFAVDQLVVAECSVERRVNDALVGIEPGDELTAGIEKLNVGDGTLIVRLPDLGHDAYSAGWKCPTILPVMAYRHR
jgi:hypothetical protein